MRENIEELIKTNKLVESGWQDLRNTAIHPNAPIVQVFESRLAFYAGAHFLYNTIINYANNGEEEITDGEVNMMKSIHEEFKNFMDEVKLMAMPTKGNS